VSTNRRIARPLARPEVAPRFHHRTIRAARSEEMIMTDRPTSLHSISDRERMPLTARERETIQLIAEGKTSKEIGALLGISVKTAESHRANIMHKLDIHDTAGLVRYAIRSGLVEA